MILITQNRIGTYEDKDENAKQKNKFLFWIRFFSLKFL